VDADSRLKDTFNKRRSPLSYAKQHSDVLMEQIIRWTDCASKLASSYPARMTSLSIWWLRYIEPSSGSNAKDDRGRFFSDYATTYVMQDLP
jgi:hypothetical protein